MQFDASLWRDRSWRKFCAGLGKSRTKNRETAWYLDQLAIDGISKTIPWCEKHGLSVNFTRRTDGAYYGDKKLIEITCNARPLRQLIYLLHECGHHLIDVCSPYDQRFAAGYAYAEHPADASLVPKLTLANRVSTLEEEFEAWRRGWKLVKKLSIDLKREHFEQVRISCLSSYILWANTPNDRQKPSSRNHS